MRHSAVQPPLFPGVVPTEPQQTPGLLLGWPVNRVVPRRHELASAGHIRQAGSVIDHETQRRATTWVAA